MTPEERLHRASEARRLLDEPLLKKALDDIEREAAEAVFASKSEDGRQVLVDRVNVIRDLRRRLELTIAMGKSVPTTVA